jgi:NAD-dependent SIR2 family protein deacetylase
MTTLKHHCTNCDTKFRVNYEVEETDSDPVYCPFCAEYIISDMEEDLDDDMDA